MSKADDIEHFCRMIAAHADTLHGVLTRGSWGYLPRLEAVIEAGGFATIGTEENIKLKNTAKDLRILADRMDAARVRLILNERRHDVSAG